MKFFLILTTIVTFENGNIDHNKTKTEMRETPYTSASQCEYNGERHIKQTLEKDYKNYGFGVYATYNCIQIN